MTIPRAFLILGVPLVVGALWLASGQAGRDGVPPATDPARLEFARGTTATAPSPRSEATMEVLAEQLGAIAAQAGELVRLGDTKSRNLFAIRSEQREMESLLAETDAFLAQSDVPEGGEAAVASYRTGAATVRAAMGEAQAGFLGFDWERVKGATERLRAGEAELAAAADGLTP